MSVVALACFADLVLFRVTRLILNQIRVGVKNARQTGASQAGAAHGGARKGGFFLIPLAQRDMEGRMIRPLRERAPGAGSVDLPSGCCLNAVVFHRHSHAPLYHGVPMNLTTPALLFPAISLLFLAYTNRFLVLAQLIRQLHDREGDQVREMVYRQINNLKKRIALIRWMQGLGVFAFILCAVAMFCLFVKMDLVAEVSFGLSLLLLVFSLVVSLYEIAISTRAIQIELEDLAMHHPKDEAADKR